MPNVTWDHIGALQSVRRELQKSIIVCFCLLTLEIYLCIYLYIVFVAVLWLNVSSMWIFCNNIFNCDVLYK